MAFRFPNELDQWRGYIYKNLRDADLVVHKNALMVLTHLILNGMIKVRDSIGEIALLLEDTNACISDLARLRGAYSSVLAQWAVFVKRKYVALAVDRVVALYDDDLHGDDVAKRALAAATMVRDLSRFALCSLNDLDAHRALLALCFCGGT